MTVSPLPDEKIDFQLDHYKIALIHDWLQAFGGGEKVLQQLYHIMPQADIFSSVDFATPELKAALGNKKINTSFIQRLPFAKKHFRKYFSLMPIAMEQFDLRNYDFVLSSSSAIAKGVLTGPDQLHISYVHSPMRYAWDLQPEYLENENLTRGLKSIYARNVLHKMRIWDARTANGVDEMIANSQFIAKRIWKVYRREAEVIYPPVDVDSFTQFDDKEDYYFTASRLVPYKRIDLIVEAFTKMPHKKLVVIGDGPQYERLKAMQTPNIELLGYQPYEKLLHHMQRARAFIFAALEDFGIVPVEAQACGTPVIAFNKGGAAETVRGLDKTDPTGLHFTEQSSDAIVSAVEMFERDGQDITPENCRKNAMNFSTGQFRTNIHNFIARKVK